MARSESRPSVGVLIAGILVVAGVLVAPTLSKAFRPESAPVPTATPAPTAPVETPTMPSVATPPPAAQEVTPAPVPTATPTPAPTPTPEPTPEPVEYGKPAPEREAVGMDYFSDALFIGDSRTEGLQLFSGIQDTTFYCYKGITVFDVMEKEPKKVITVDGVKCSIQDALRDHPDTFKKVYLSLGVNELGYFDDEGFRYKFSELIDLVRETQPNAIIYLQNLVPVNPELCAKYWPEHVNNKKVADYNAIFDQLAVDKQVVLLDVAGALSNSEGILDKENTVDGVHFTKAWYKEWLSYLMSHTVEP